MIDFLPPIIAFLTIIIIYFIHLFREQIGKIIDNVFVSRSLAFSDAHKAIIELKSIINRFNHWTKSTEVLKHTSDEKKANQLINLFSEFCVCKARIKNSKMKQILVKINSIDDLKNNLIDLEMLLDK